MRGSIHQGQRLALFSNRRDRLHAHGRCLPVDLLLLLDYACNLRWHCEAREFARPLLPFYMQMHARRLAFARNFLRNARRARRYKRESIKKRSQCETMARWPD